METNSDNMRVFANPQMEWKNLLSHKKSLLLQAENSLVRHSFEEFLDGRTGEISKIRLHPADLATNTQELETLNLLSEKTTKELQAVDEALERLAQGTYGFCLSCQDPIPPERLRVLPEARLCLECEEEMERDKMQISPEHFPEDVTAQINLIKALGDIGKVEVANIMQKSPITVHMLETIDTAAGLFLDHNIRHLPVLDHRGDIQGVVSDRDVLKILLRIRPGKLRERIENEASPILIQNIMTKTPETISPETSLSDAGALLLENKFSCLPVVEGNRLVGIVTTTDFVRLLSPSDEKPAS